MTEFNEGKKKRKPEEEVALRKIVKTNLDLKAKSFILSFRVKSRVKGVLLFVIIVFFLA